MGRRREATVEDLYRVGEDVKAELVNGELVIMTPAGGRHGYACAQICGSLVEYARRTKWGLALPDNVGFIVNLPNRRSFSPDAAFWTGGPLTEDFIEGAPVFAAEVRSKDDYGPAAERGTRADAEPALPGWSMPVEDLFPPKD